MTARKGDHARYVTGSAVVLLHLVFAWLLSESHARVVAQPGRSNPIQIVFLEPNETAALSPAVASITDVAELLVPDVPDVDIPPLSLEESDANGAEAANGIIVAPRVLEYELPEVATYAHIAGLSPGQSSTVVLRIEVLPDGTVGRVRIDVSSGSKQVDEAAIGFAQRTRWIPGSVNGINERVWTRYGVQLIA